MFLKQVIRCLLIEPFPESALNEQAGKMLLENYEEYARLARYKPFKCTLFFTPLVYDSVERPWESSLMDTSDSTMCFYSRQIFI